MPKSSRLLLVLYASTLLADTYPRQPGVDVQHYVFRVSLSDDNDAIEGETTVDLRFVNPGVAQFGLDLASAKDGKGMTVSEVSANGVMPRYSHASDRLTITLPEAPRAGERRQVTVKYRGVPAAGLRFVKNKYGERGIFSANWPDLAHQWLPTIDHPYDKATSEFIVTVPVRYQVVANGRLVEELDLGDGRRVTHWQEAAPIATWLNNIAVAQFASRHFGNVAGVPLETWVFHQDRDKGIATFEEPARRAVEFFSEYVGPYPYEKLAHVQNGAAAGGGMEHASAIFYGQNAVSGTPAYSLVAHETAHQWFGDSVTEKDWDDVWLSEGFATYFSLLCTEHFEGRDAFVAGLKRSRGQIFPLEKRLGGTSVVQDKPWSGIPNGVIYQKGGWTLHMLRGLIGSERFHAGIREYYRRYRDGNASTADFRAVMEAVAGMNLEWFFQQWLYRPGSPAIEGTWSYDTTARSVTIELAQMQDGEPYRLPIEVGITAPGRQGAPQMRIEKIEMTGKQQKFGIAADQAPNSVELDPNTWVLMDTKFVRR